MKRATVQRWMRLRVTLGAILDHWLFEALGWLFALACLLYLGARFIG